MKCPTCSKELTCFIRHPWFGHMNHEYVCKHCGYKGVWSGGRLRIYADNDPINEHIAIIKHAYLNWNNEP